MLTGAQALYILQGKTTLWVENLKDGGQLWVLFLPRWAKNHPVDGKTLYGVCIQMLSGVVGLGCGG